MPRRGWGGQLDLRWREQSERTSQRRWHLLWGLKQEHVCACVLSCFSLVQLFMTLWAVAHQAPLSMGFSRQEYWSGLPCSFPGDLLDPGIKPESHVSCIGRWILYH